MQLAGTCRVVEALASQVSPLAPDQVPSKERHTLPQLYKFGLKRTDLPPASRQERLLQLHLSLHLLQTT